MKDPVNTPLTPDEMRMLAEIFRLIPREIENEEDTERLAPGEIGIDYKEGTFYIRNPHNGKIISPNSMAKWKIVEGKIEKKTNYLNADKISGIRFYDEIGKLNYIPGINYTPDTLIRQMDSPSVFFGEVKYTNWEALGWPTADGVCLVLKYNEENVFIRYSDKIGYLSFEGRYNNSAHMFEGWAKADASGDISATIKKGGPNAELWIEKDPYDLLTVSVRTEAVVPENTGLITNGGDRIPIINLYGEPINYPIEANNTIMLLFDEQQKSWILLDPSVSPVYAITTIMQGRMKRLVESTDEKLRNMEEDYGTRISGLVNKYDLLISRLRDSTIQLQEAVRHDIDTLINTTEEKLNELEQTYNSRFNEAERHIEGLVANLSRTTEAQIQSINETIRTRPGNLHAQVVDYVVENDNTTEITIPGFNGNVDILIVNYGDTILQVGMDYKVTENGIETLAGINFMVGEVIQFIIFKQATD